MIIVIIFEELVWILHNIIRRRSQTDGDRFNLGENVLNMNEETMDLPVQAMVNRNSFNQ